MRRQFSYLEKSYTFSAQQMKARVVGGTEGNGRLEILYNGTWNTVCNNGFHNKEAQVACRMLGFSRCVF